MKAIWWGLASLGLVAACSVEEDDSAWQTSVPERPQAEGAERMVGVTLSTSSPLAIDSLATFTVTGAVAGERVYFVATNLGEGAGACPAPLGGTCLDIRSPFRLLGSAVADSRGTAAFDWLVPSVPLPFNFSLQAAIPRGVDGDDSVVSNVITQPIVSPSPDISAEPSLLDFDSAPPGCVETLSVALVSDGATPVRVNAISLPAGFTLATAVPLPVEIAPGDALDLEIAFQPNRLGGFDADGLVSTSAGDLILPLAGAGEIGSICEGAMTTELSYSAVYKKADVTFLLDTTCSMGSTLTALNDEFAAIALELREVVPDLTFGVATFQDYNFGSFGSGPDRPFVLVQQQTTDQLRAAIALDDLTIAGGGDGPESAIEALVQTLGGTGYDQDCDGRFDSADDVRPFRANPLDAFAGAVGGVYDSSVPGTGNLGGMGYRADVPPFIIYATDNSLRDPSAGYGSPGGCDDAVLDDLVALSEVSGAKIFGLATSAFGYGDYVDEMKEVALAVGSAIDANRDGVLDPAVLEWSGSSEAFRTAVVRGVEGLATAEDFGVVDVRLISDPGRVVVGVEPDAFYSVEAGSRLDFDLTVNGTVVAEPEPGSVTVTLGLIANDTVRLETIEVYVLP